MSSNVTLNPKMPFATFFTVQNLGIFRISKVEYRSQLMIVPPPGIQMKRLVAQEQNVTYIPELRSLETYSLSVGYPSVKVDLRPITQGGPPVPIATMPIGTASSPTNGQIIAGTLILEFNVTYKPRFFGTRTDKICFFSMLDTSGGWQWMPCGHDNFADQTIDTNLFKTTFRN